MQLCFELPQKPKLRIYKTKQSFCTLDSDSKIHATLRYLLVAAAWLMLDIVHGANLGLGAFFET